MCEHVTCQCRYDVPSSSLRQRSRRRHVNGSSTAVHVFQHCCRILSNTPAGSYPTLPQDLIQHCCWVLSNAAVVSTLLQYPTRQCIPLHILAAVSNTATVAEAAVFNTATVVEAAVSNTATIVEDASFWHLSTILNQHDRHAGLRLHLPHQ